MVKADELIRMQREKNDKKKKTFNKIYSNIEKKIVMASATDSNYLWCEIPEYLLGSPFYKLEDCKNYIIEKLKSNSFECEFYDPNILLIKWFDNETI